MRVHTLHNGVDIQIGEGVAMATGTELTSEEIERLRKRDSLPMPSSILMELSEIIGEEAAIRLVRFMPGEKVEFPRKPKAGSFMSLLLTPQQIAALHAHYGAGRVRLTPSWSYLNMLDARAMRAQGKSIAYILRALRISQSSLANYLKGQPVGNIADADKQKASRLSASGTDIRVISIKTGISLSHLRAILRSSVSIPQGMNSDHEQHGSNPDAE